jgi:putative phosphoribosyl transferase
MPERRRHRGDCVAGGGFVAMPRAFRNRAEAGRRLAGALRHLAGRSDVLVLGLPRGGVPVAYEVAKALGAPLDVFVVRKLGVPGHRELAFGAIASGGVRVLTDEIGRRLDPTIVDAVAAAEEAELRRRERAYRGDSPPVDVAGKTMIVVDDGLATGASMRAAVVALRALGPARIVVAVPTAAPAACDDFRDEVDEVICADTPADFTAVGERYDDFSDTSDEEVRSLLADAKAA